MGSDRVRFNGGVTSQEQAINRAVKNKWQYEQDISQHLIEVAGFHLRLKNSGDPHRILSYMQAYTTDKSATYHPGRNSFSKQITAKQAMAGEDGCPSAPSWDTFACPYISIHKGANASNPKLHATSQELIGVLKEEYV
ncbi:hypothetical protein M378DRAFT_15927 [Amanita muscaria Koide BX008]|uniref:Uncharacterized protein n=1 Tax=Amanita muscaria (strain Koide BX008) TaxID=946122 RepID=A0A0C2WNW6_AMAMK|nr:hypothetical protein M378DRAFT_15927 [Amanita muscaria Koide BX008]